jgi:hemerythrin
MEEAAYPKLVAHKAEHEDLTRRVREKDFEQGRIATGITCCSS